MTKKIYIGSICHRDLDAYKQIKKIAKLNYNIEIKNLLKKDGTFSTKHFKKKIKKYRFACLLVKLFSGSSNQVIYNAIKNYASNIPRINTLNSVHVCESRKETFRLIEKKCKKIRIPKCYYSIKSAYDAVNNGTKIIIKLDTHNIKNLSKYDRIVGIARSPKEFLKLIRNYNVENNVLFFQEYLGKFEIIYKTYVIDRYAITITAHNRLRHNKLTPLELIHIRVPMEKLFKRKILQLGRKFGMSIYGIDYVLKDGVPYIVDVNDFPSFRRIPEANSLISDYIYNFLIDRLKVHKTLVKVKAL